MKIKKETRKDFMLVLNMSFLVFFLIGLPLSLVKLHFLKYFWIVLISKIIFLKYYFNTFLIKKYFEKQYLTHSRTS